jgi:hypothetical protein
MECFGVQQTDGVLDPLVEQAMFDSNRPGHGIDGRESNLDEVNPRIGARHSHPLIANYQHNEFLVRLS